MKKETQEDTPIAKKKNFINKKDLLAEIIACKANGEPPYVLSDKLAKMLMLMCKQYGRKGNWTLYSYKEDMISFALLNLVQNWWKFDESRFDNPFAFYTTAIYRSFLQYNANEKEQRLIRDAKLIDGGYYAMGYDKQKQLE